MKSRFHSVRRGIIRSGFPLYVCIGIVILFGAIGFTTAQQAEVLPTPTIDPFFLTVTAIITEATATEQAKLGPTMTPTPTLTSLEMENLRLQWKAELEKATGFTHPIFDYITYDSLESLFGFHARDNEFTVEVKRTNYKDAAYVALAVGDQWFAYSFYLFKVVVDIPVLLTDSTHEGIDGYYVYLNDFGDSNGNDYPDLTIGTNGGGNCIHDLGAILLEIQPNGSVISVPLPQGEVVGFKDIDRDGLPEISTSDFTVVPNYSFACSEYAITHWYKWDGTAYQNISAIVDVSLYPEIEAYWESAQQQDGCLLPDYAMYRMLLGYFSMGRLEEGWSKLAPQLRWDKCSTAILQQEGAELGQFLEWVGTYLEESKQTP